MLELEGSEAIKVATAYTQISCLMRAMLSEANRERSLVLVNDENQAIGRLKPEGVEAHFIVAACENMVSETAIRPGDILTASNGKTIEVPQQPIGK